MLRNFSKKDFTATNILIIITVLMYVIQINIPKGGLLFGLNLYFYEESQRHLTVHPIKRLWLI